MVLFMQLLISMVTCEFIIRVIMIIMQIIFFYFFIYLFIFFLPVRVHSNLSHPPAGNHGYDNIEKDMQVCETETSGSDEVLIIFIFRPYLLVLVQHSRRIILQKVLRIFSSTL